jgi:hypothetical protein
MANTSTNSNPSSECLRPRSSARPLPLAMESRKWQPGQSGNPSGSRGARYEQMVKLCRDASPTAAARLIELIGSDDQRVSYMACLAVLERAYGKPREMPPIDHKPADKTRRNETVRALFKILDDKAAAIHADEAHDKTQGAMTQSAGRLNRHNSGE